MLIKKLRALCRYVRHDFATMGILGTALCYIFFIVSLPILVPCALILAFNEWTAECFEENNNA